MNRWYNDMKTYFAALPSTEEVAASSSTETALKDLKAFDAPKGLVPLLPTPNLSHRGLDEKMGLRVGATVSVAPDDTGRDE